MRSGEFTVKDAALACGVSESTIRRRLSTFSHARRDDRQGGSWVISADDLRSQGFTIDPDVGAGGTETDQVLGGLTREVGLLTTEVDELERANGELDAQNRELQRRVGTAEAALVERDATINELNRALGAARQQLRVLETDSVELPVSDHSTGKPSVSTEPTSPRSERAQRLAEARRALDEIGRPGSD